uniref:Myosin XVB n=1 Tax=Strix occidentalis caurina TaxID=311401 RepID=A0A8D0KWC8_STROC
GSRGRLGVPGARGLLSLAGQYRAQANQITEALPPEVKVKDDLSLPPTINSYPFSSFIKSHFQKTDFPPPGQPLQHPLTHLEAEYQGSALEINKLILRFIGDKNLHGWQEVLLGNYIAGRGLNNVALRNEIFSQVVAQTWKNPDMEHSQRAWVLMATLLSCFAPSPALEKPLLKFVSDHGMEGYNAVCQRKILTAAQYTEVDSTFSRAYPPTQLEWTANQRRGKMVLDVHTFNEEKFSAEVESWMTGEQYAGWLLSDLLGCDFVLDLIGEMEEASNFSSLSQSDEYPITPERDRSFLQYSDLDSAHRHCNSFLQAQQMTLQAMSISQQQQQRQQSLANSRPRVSSPPRAQAPAPVSTPVPATSPKPKKHPSSQNAAPPKAPEPPAKAEEPLSSPIAPASPLPPFEPKPKKQTPKVKKEPPVVKPSGPKTRPEPSREIRNIIKMYQSRPAPEPQPIEPSTVMQRMTGSNGFAVLQPTPLPQEKTPPPLKPKPGSASSSIKEKQLPLLSIFSPEGTPPSAPPPPPPLPSPLLPGSPGWQESTGKVADDEGIKTQLYKLTTSVSFSYANPAWKIFLRKEVFYPKENFSHPYCLNLLCEQIMRDTFSDSCFRISKEEKRKMKDLLMEFRVGNDVQSIQEDGIKKRIVLAARDNWANYFSRLFPVHGEKGSDVQILGVSHRGVRLLKVVKHAGCVLSFADVLSVEMKGSDALEFSLKTEQLILHSPKAPCIKAMVELFIQQLRQDTNYVVALRSYITDDKSLLSFKKGDLIELLPMQGVEPGWQFGSTGGRCGIFPTSLVQLAAAPDYLSTSMDRHGGLQKSMKASPESRNTSREVSCPWGTSREPNSIMLVPAGDHYTMMDFATAYFREAQTCGWSRKAFRTFSSLLPAPWQDHLCLDLNAHLCFAALMRFMGDQSKLKNQNEVNCIYEILQVCDLPLGKVLNRNCLVLRCSQFFLFHRESVLRGWLLLNLLTGYFLPSNILMPYATKFLQLASSDPSSTHHGMTVSGGIEVCRKAPVPGHRAQPTLSAPRVMTLSLCKHVDKMVRPIRSEEYLHDYLLEDNLVTVTLRRLIWRTPLHFENKIYTDVHYGQVSNKASVSTRNVPSRGRADAQAHGSVPWGEELNEYTPKTLQSSIRVQALESHVGMLLRTRQPLQPVDAKIQFIAWEHLQLLTVSSWCSRLPAGSCCLKATFCFLTEHMMKLPFFGYNIYFVERVSDDTIPVPCFFGVNKEEIIVVDDTTQAVSCVIPLKELQKMRTLRPVSDGGLPGIELNYGSAASPKTMWFELSQVRSAWTYSFFLATQKLPSTAQLSLC